MIPMRKLPNSALKSLKDSGFVTEFIPRASGSLRKLAPLLEINDAGKVRKYSLLSVRLSRILTDNHVPFLQIKPDIVVDKSFIKL